MMNIPTAKEVRCRWEAVSPASQHILANIKEKLIDSEYVRQFAPNFTISITGCSPTVGDKTEIVRTLEQAGYVDIKVTVSEESSRPKITSVSFKLP